MKKSNKYFKKINKIIFKKREFRYLNLKEIDLEFLIKSLLIYIPFSSLIYLIIFYQSFNISYLLYFNPIDLTKTLYDIFIIELVRFIYLMLLIIIIHILIDFSEKFIKYKINKCFKIFTVLIIIFSPTFIDINFYKVSLIIIILYIGLLTNYFKPIYIIVLFATLSFIIENSENDAKTTKNIKTSFNIIDKQNNYILKESNNSNRDYFIGKTTDFVFIYSYSTKKIKVIPTTEIKEINFNPTKQ